MSEETTIPTESAVIKAYASGKLIDVIFGSHISHHQVFIDLCASLHNSNRIDLLALAQSEDIYSLKGIHFFSGQHFFCAVIPKINGSTDEMMKVVDKLVQKGGADLTANQPNASFRNWCKADPTRAYKVIEGAKAENPLAIQFLTFALEAGNLIRQHPVNTAAALFRGFGVLARIRLPDWHSLQEVASSKAGVRRACGPGARRCGPGCRPARLADPRRSSWP